MNENELDEELDKQISSYELKSKEELFNQLHESEKILNSNKILYSGNRLRKIARRKIKIPTNVLEKIIKIVDDSKNDTKDKNIAYLIQTLKYSLLNGNSCDENEYEALIMSLFKLIQSENSNPLDLRIQIVQCLYFVLKKYPSKENLKKMFNACLLPLANQINVSHFYFPLMKKTPLEDCKKQMSPKWILADKPVNKPAFITKTLFKANHRNSTFLSEETLSLGGRNTGLFKFKRKHYVQEVILNQTFTEKKSDENKSDWSRWSFLITNIVKLYGKVKNDSERIDKKDLEFLLVNFSEINFWPNFFTRKYLENIIPFMILETLLETVKLDKHNKRTSLNSAHVEMLLKGLDNIVDFKFKYIDTSTDRERMIKYFNVYEDVSNKSYPDITKRAFKEFGQTTQDNLVQVLDNYLNEWRSCVFEIARLLCCTVHREIILKDEKLKDNGKIFMESDNSTLKNNATDFFSEYYDHLQSEPNKTFFSNILDALLKNANEISKANDILLMIDSDSNRDYLDLCNRNLVKICELVVNEQIRETADIFYSCISKYNLELFQGDDSSILSMNNCIAGVLKLKDEYIIGIILDILLHHVQGEKNDDTKIEQFLCKELCVNLKEINEQVEDSTW
jgi:hypothetical protein